MVLKGLRKQMENLFWLYYFGELLHKAEGKMEHKYTNMFWTWQDMDMRGKFGLEDSFFQFVKWALNLYITAFSLHHVSRQLLLIATKWNIHINVSVQLLL